MFDFNRDALPQKLQQAIDLVETRLTIEAGQVFRNNVGAIALIEDWMIEGVDWTNLTILPADQMSGIDGAYDASEDRILISDRLLEPTTSIQRLSDVLAEELGHRIDARLGGGDTLGDEGEAFAVALRGDTTEKFQDDTTATALETAVTVSDSGGFEGSSEVLSLEGTGGGTITFFYEHYTIPDRFIIVYEGQELLDTGFTGGSRSGTINLPAGTSDQLFIRMVTDDAGTAWNYTVTAETGDCPDTGVYTLAGETNEFEADPDDPDQCITSGTVTVGRNDGLGTVLRTTGTSAAEHTATSYTARGGTTFLTIGGVSESIFTGNFDLDLTSGVADLSGTGRGNLAFAGLAVDVQGLAIQRTQVGLDVEFTLPNKVGGVTINTATFGDKVVQVSNGGIEEFTLDDGLPVGLELELGIFDVDVKKLALTYKPSEEVFWFQGLVVLEDEVFDRLFAPDAEIELNFDDVGFGDPGYIQLNANGELDAIGSATLNGPISLFRGFSLAEVELTIDTTSSQVSGAASIGTPFGVRFDRDGVSAGIQLDFTYGPFQFDGFQLNLDNLNKQIPGANYFYFQSIGGGLANLAPSNPQAASAILTTGVTLGPQVNFADALGGRLGRFDGEFEVANDSSAELRGEFKLLDTSFELEIPFLPDILVDFTLLEGVINADLDWGRGTLAVDGRLSVAEGLFTTASSLRFDSNFNFGVSGVTTFTLPSWLPDWAGGGSSVGGNFAMKFSNDDVYANDYVSVWGTFTSVLGNDFTKGLRINFDGDLSIIGSNNIPLTSSWFVSAGRDFVILNAVWENDTSGVAVRVIHPDGSVIEEADFAANGIAVLDDFSGGTSRVVIIDSPEEGTWDLEVVDTTGLGQVSYFADGEIDQADVSDLILAEQVGGDVLIEWAASQVTPNTTITFYYDEDLSTLDGLEIGTQTISDGSGNLAWNADIVVPGSYFVYGLVDDGQGPIQTITSTSAVTVGQAADVEVEIEAGSQTPRPGEQVTYTVIVRNNDASNLAQGVTALVSLGDGGTLASSSVSSTTTTLADFAFDVGDLAAGEEREIELVIDLASSLSTSDRIVLDTVLLSDSFDPDSSNDLASAEIEVAAPAVETGTVNLSVSSNFRDLSAPTLGESVTYEIEVTNTGTADAENVVLSELAPGLTNLQFSTANTSGAVPSTQLDTIAAGETVTVTVTGQVSVGGTLRNTTSVTTDSVDTVFTDNEQITSVSALGTAPESVDLSVGLTEDSSTGSTVLSVSITNDGPGTASDVLVRVDLPSGASVLRQSAIQGIYNATNGIWNIGNMRDGLTRVIDLELDGTFGGNVIAEVVGLNEMDSDSVPDDGQGDDFATLFIGSGSGRIDGTAGDDVLNTLPGPTEIDLRAGGADTVRGDVADFFGDQIDGFSEDDQLVFVDEVIERGSITVTTGSAILGIDDDDDGATDGSLTLEGDFSGGDFMAVTDGTDTTVTFETFLPTLSEKTAVDAALVNGVNNQVFLTADGTHDFRITLDASARSGYHNTVGVYEIDAAGNIVNVRILIADTHDDPSATVDITGVAAGNQLGFFIVQNSAGFADGLDPTDTLSFINSSGGSTAANIADGADLMLAVNGTSAGVTVFHSYDMSLNTDGVGHALTGVDAGGESLTMGFEDLTGGGDRDYQDVVFSVERFIEPETIDRSAETTAQSITTGDGDDTVIGGSAGDTISTGDGDDVITGGAGDDQLIGGDDADQFIFGLGDGNDVIEDFSIGLDMLILNDGLTIASTSEADLGGGADLDTLVTLSSGQTVTLWDVNGLTNTDDLLTA